MTLPNGTYTAVVDRFEADLAALEVSGHGQRVERALARDRLPEAARQPDAVLTVQVEDDEIVDLNHDEAASEERRDAAQRRFDRLSRRLSSNDDGADDRSDTE